MIVAAISRGDVADYVNALFLVYIILIFARVLMSWLPRIPRSATLRPVLDFITDTTDPYLNIFRGFIPRIGPIDISPIFAILVLQLGGSVIVGLIRG